MLVAMELKFNWEERTTERLKNRYIACSSLMGTELEVHATTPLHLFESDSKSSMPYYWEIIFGDGRHYAGWSRSEEVAKQHAVEYLLALIHAEEK